MGRTRVAVVALLAVLSTGACGSAGSEGRPRFQRLTILHTSDLHGHVFPDRNGEGSLLQVASLVASVGGEVHHPLLVFDSGDAIQGTPLEQLTHVRWGEPSPTVSVMNRIGYSAMAVGNHELNFGREVLDRALRQAEFPFLSANIIDRDRDAPAFPPYLVLEAGAVRVGVLGLTTPDIPSWERPEHYRGLDFQAMDRAARHWVQVLRQEQRCDLVVVLAHTGFERHPTSGLESGTAGDDFGWRLSQVPGIDLLLTGHTHDDIAPVLANGVVVSQPACCGRLVTRIDLELARKPGGWRVVRWEGRNLPVAGLAPDEGLMAELAAVAARVDRELERPVGHCTAPVSVDRCLVEDCAALDLVHRVQLEASGAQLSMASRLSGRTPPLAAGSVNWRWVHDLYVYPNVLVMVRVSGAQVRDLLEHTARFYDGLECSASERCEVLTDRLIAHYNTDSMAGVSYRIDPTRPEGQRVRDLRYQGAEVALDASFTLVVNNYRAAGGGGFPHLAKARRIWQSEGEVTELIGEYLSRHDPWTAQVDGNWRVAPDPPLSEAR